MASAEEHEGIARSSPSETVVYHAIRHEGEGELERPSAALAWSGLGAGLAMGLSFLAVGLLHAHLPHAKWTVLVTSFGYTIGFVIVILGRQQLFTENTLTVVLPLLSGHRADTLANVLRVWGVVLAANVVGALLFALVLARTEVVDAETWKSLKQAAEEAHRGGMAVTLLRAIVAGWLIALVVWLMPFAEAARVGVIVILTWLISAGHFVHIIAGSVEVGFLVFVGARTWADFLGSFFVPALLGNIIGGVALVAAINHAQAKAGEPEKEEPEGIIIA
ncbi:MAG TPA: formate/nitrite transporter family protein [Thermoanaerobaculia bacterium]